MENYSLIQYSYPLRIGKDDLFDVVVDNNDNKLMNVLTTNLVIDLIKRANAFDELIIFVRSISDNLKDENQVDFFNQLAKGLLKKHDSLKELTDEKNSNIQKQSL